MPSLGFFRLDESRTDNTSPDSLDDPLIWGILPLRYAVDVENLRWSLGAHDICFKNKCDHHYPNANPQPISSHLLTWYNPDSHLLFLAWDRSYQHTAIGIPPTAVYIRKPWHRP